MGLLKEFRPVASTKGHWKICKSRGALSRKIFFSFRQYTHRAEGGRKEGGGGVGALTNRLPGSDGPCRWYMSARHSFLFSSIFFFFIMPWWFRGSVEISAFKLNILQVVANGVWCRLVMADAKVRKKFQFAEAAFRTNSLYISHAVSYIY